MPLLDEQFSYGDFVCGPGTEFFVNRADGFNGYETRSSDSDQPRGDGGLRGLDYVAPKTLSLELAIVEVIDNSGETYESMWKQVRAAFAPSRSIDGELHFKRPGTIEQFIRCRPIQLTRTEEYKRFNRVGFPPVVFRAVDPRIYSAVINNAVVPLFASVSGGTETPFEFPVDFTGGMQSELVVSNEGTADAYPVINFYGPLTGTCTSVTLTNSTNGSSTTITTPVVNGQILTADMQAAITGVDRLVISLDGSTRYAGWALPRAPLYLSPGSNNLRFQITGTSTDVVCGLTWHHTWMD